MIFFGIVFVLYFLKLSGTSGFLNVQKVIVFNTWTKDFCLKIILSNLKFSYIGVSGLRRVE